MKTNYTIYNTFAKRIAVLAIVLMIIGIGNAWGLSVTYTTSSGSPSASGNTITGASASFADVTYNSNHTQMLKDGYVELTLTSLGGISISNISLSMRSNSDKGAGTLCYSTDGGSSWTYLVGSAGSGVKFNNSAWYGSWSTSYVTVSKSVSLSNVTQLKIRIDATANSLYCQSFTLTYTAAAPATSVTVSPTNITFDDNALSSGEASGTSSLDISVTNGSQSSGQYLCVWVESDDEDNCEFTINDGDYSTCSGSSTSIDDLSVEYYAISAGTFTGRVTVNGYKANGDPVEKVVELSVTITASCEASPTIGNPTLTSITSGTIAVSCPSIGAGASCAINDYGFVWKASSAPTISDNKTQVSTNNQSSAFSKNLSIAFTTGVTYYIKAYATNNGDNTTLSSTALQVTPRSITFNSNGGSAVSTKYVNSGSTVSQPSNPTRDGYTFNGWKLSGSTYNFATAVTSDITLDADWSAHTYTVAFNKNGGGDGTGTASQAFTYGVAQNLNKCGFTAPDGKYFLGWNTNSGASVATYTDQQSVSNLTTTNGETVTLYAIWGDHTYTNYRTVCTQPEVTISGSIKVTSTASKSVKATGVLTVSGTNIGTANLTVTSNNAAFKFCLSANATSASYTSSVNIPVVSNTVVATPVYVEYTPAGGSTSDGIDDAIITVSDGAGTPTTASTSAGDVQGRHLPAKFLIATKIGGDWYALPNNMSSYGNPDYIKLSSVNETTGVATYYSDQYDGEAVGSKNYLTWTLNSVVSTNNANYGYPQHGNRVRFYDSKNSKYLEVKASDDDIKNSVASPGTADHPLCEFLPTTSDLIDYTLKNEGQVRYLGVDGGKWGDYTSSTTIRFLIPDQQPAATITWYNDMLDAEHATNKAENGVVSLPAGADPLCCVAGTAAGLSFDGWVTATWEGYRTTGFTKVNAGDAATTNKTYYAVFKTEDNKYFTKCPNTQTVTYSDGAGNTVVETYFVDGSGKQITCKDIGTGEGQVNLSKSGYVLIGWTTSANYGSAFKYVGNTVTLYPSSSEQAYKGDLVLTAVWVGELTITGDVHLTSTYTSAARSEANTVYTTANPNNLLTVSAAGVPASVASNLKIRVSYLTSADETQASSTCPFRLCNDGSSNYNIVDGSNLDITSGDYSQTYAIGYKPSMAGGASGTTETYKLKLELINSGGDKVFSTAIKEMYGRILPTKFVVAAKVGGAWRALPADIATGSGSAMGDAYPISVDADGAPTVATYAPKAALYSGTVRAHNAHQGGIRLTTATGDGSDGQLQATRSDNAYLWRTTSDCKTGMQEWYLVSSDFGNYEVRLDPTLKRSSSGSEDEGGDAIEYVTRQLCVNGNKILFGTTSAKTFRILPVTNEYEPVDLQVVEWKSDAIRFMYYGNPSYTASVEIDGVLKSAAPATLGTALKIDEGVYEIAVSDLMTSAYKPLYIIIKNGGTEIGRKQIYVPLMVNTTTTVATAATGYTKGTQCPQMDLIVLPGGKLTADDATAYEFKTITVYGGGKLIVAASKGITATSAMNLRAGSVNVSSKGSTPSTSYIYTYPEVYLGASATLTVPGNKINFDYLTNYDQYFGLALPYPVTINATTDIFYPSDIYGAQAKRGSFMLRAFDSKIRAAQGAVSAVWVDVEEGSTGSGGSIAAQSATVRGLGYTFLGVPLKVSINGGSKTRQTYGIHRMIMDVTGASELSTAENANAAIHVDTYSASQIFNTGWWMLGNPYMASLNDGDRVSGTSITVGTIGTNAEGQYEWKSTSVRYVTVPDDAGGDTYDQRRVVDYTFPAFKPFYVQVGTSGDVTFSYTSRNAAAPARFSDNGMPNEINVSVALNTAAYGDTTYLLIGDAFSDAYEIGDDMMKMPHANVSLFTVTSEYDLFANALNKQSAEAGVPVGYVAPSAGTYEFEHVETDESAWLEHLWLEDHETGTTVDLLDNSYEFETIAGTNKTRFVLFAVLKKTSETPTDIDGASEDKVDRPMKFIYRDKLYILRSGKIYDSTGKLVKKINK